MKPIYYKVIILLAVALGAGYLLLPDPKEEISAYLKDGNFQEAYRLTDRLVKGGNRDPYILVELAKLQSLVGDLDAYEETLKLILKTDPGNLEIHEMMLNFYLTLEKEDGYFEQLDYLARHSPDLQYLETLIGRRRLQGQYEQETELLKLFAARGEMPTVYEQRLVMLLLKDGNAKEALSYFRKMDSDRDADQTLWPMRAQIFKLLLRQGQNEEALERAGHWLENSINGSPLTIGLTIMFNECLKFGRADLISNLSSQVIAKHPQMSFLASSYALKLGNKAQVNAYLDALIAANYPFSDGDAETMISLKSTIGDLDGAISFLRSYGPDKVSHDAIANLLEDLFASHEDVIAEEIGHYLPQEQLPFYPLVASRFALMEGNRSEANYYFKQVELENVTKSQTGLWFDLARQLLSADDLIGLFTLIKDLRALPEDLLSNYADFVRNLDESEYMRVLTVLGGAFPVQGVEPLYANDGLAQ
ncbi:hypothetical protein [uncultured Cohaesibacter sp.]|uniref:tetratricopeptide repeat protein n=1 Tax=uncultured Cohaesibacter sp. TaxID=1002546 RepID=UPI00292F3133|nr:hypothetical protein [uncultured Cohaesibacter sp.]